MQISQYCQYRKGDCWCGKSFRLSKPALIDSISRTAANDGLQHAAAIDACEKSHTATATMYELVDVKCYSNGR